MAIQRTLCIIKPDAVERRVQGHILQRLLDEGFRVVALRQAHLTRVEAEGFYAVHRERPFFDELCTFMTRGPVVLVALERENAVQHYRDVIGATDPAKAAPGTIRKLYGTNVGENACHGSDSEENGIKECGYFFPGAALL
ncbi:MAG: nucleoside-diphosphate kinase [Polyangiaceae bacterium]